MNPQTSYRRVKALTVGVGTVENVAGATVVIIRSMYTTPGLTAQLESRFLFLRMLRSDQLRPPVATGLPREANPASQFGLGI